MCSDKTDKVSIVNLFEKIKPIISYYWNDTNACAVVGIYALSEAIKRKSIKKNA